MTIALAIVNYDLGTVNMPRARKLVEIGDARWVRSSLATLKLVPYGLYSLGEDEQFVEETDDGRWVPAWAGRSTGQSCGDGGPHVPSGDGTKCDRCGDAQLT